MNRIFLTINFKKIFDTFIKWWTIKIIRIECNKYTETKNIEHILTATSNSVAKSFACSKSKRKIFLAPFLGIQPCLSLSLSFFSLWMILGNNIRSWQPFVCCWASQKKRSIKYFGTHNGSDMKNVGNKTKLNSRIQKSQRCWNQLIINQYSDRSYTLFKWPQ